MNRSNLPLLTHDQVLGVDIAYAQRYEDGCDLYAYGSDRPPAAHQCHRYMAAWARRNLFGGEP